MCFVKRVINCSRRSPFATIGQLVAHLRLLERKSVKGHVRCPCGSGRRLRDCHAELVRKQRVRVPPRLARRMLVRIAEELRRIRGTG
ncbi:SEC-C metal-binding domain-containing protein [Roseovarius sp. MBR-78]|uniref:SEC-C metal-binding domain-containing protein n=1 Tax=Roseovarius sp. MBR-78 TaxID=3156460 RepID=UPI003390FCF9